MTEIAWGITVELGCLSPYNSLLCVYIVMMSLTGVVFEDSDKSVLMATRERERERECVCVSTGHSNRTHMPKQMYMWACKTVVQ